ncbi:MAG: hypothetical protein QM764_02380 [Chitinophagaceae bacterium]
MGIDDILAKKGKYSGILIDTNLLLLLLIGSFDPSQIGKNKRLKKFSESDFRILKKLTILFQEKIVVTTHIITEICNLSDNYNSEIDFKFFVFLKEILSRYLEKQEKSITIIERNETAFYKLGIADASITDLAKQNTLIITDDLKLYHYISSLNYDAINYNHLLQL